MLINTTHDGDNQKIGKQNFAGTGRSPLGWAKGQHGLLCRPFVRVRVPDGVVAHPLGPSLAKFFFLSFFIQQANDRKVVVVVVVVSELARVHTRVPTIKIQHVQLISLHAFFSLVDHTHSPTLTHTHTHNLLTHAACLPAYHCPTHFQCLLRRLLSKQKIEKFLLKRKQIEKAFWGVGRLCRQLTHTHTHTIIHTHAHLTGPECLLS